MSCVLVVVAMALIDSRLTERLRTALPADAPSVFLVDVQPDQWEGVERELKGLGAAFVRAQKRSLDAAETELDFVAPQAFQNQRKNIFTVETAFLPGSNSAALCICFCAFLNPRAARIP